MFINLFDLVANSNMYKYWVPMHQWENLCRRSGISSHAHEYNYFTLCAYNNIDMGKEKQIKKIWLQYGFGTFCFKSSV